VATLATKFSTMFAVQDEKNQIMATNVWLEQVRLPCDRPTVLSLVDLQAIAYCQLRCTITLT